MTEIDQDAPLCTQETFRPQPDGSIDPAGEAGWFLQRERERRALSLEQVAAETGIHESHLDGIEHGDLTRLPSRMEALKMVGIYGQCLGFDPEPLIVHYAEFLPRPIAPANSPGSQSPRPLSSATVISFTHALRHAPLQRMSRTIGSCLAALIVIGAALWLLVAQSPDEDLTAAIDPLPTASLTPEADLDAAPASEAQVSIVETPMSDDQSELPSAADGQAARQASEQGSLAALIARTIREGDAQGQEKGVESDSLSTLPDLPDVLPGDSIAQPVPSQGRTVGEENSKARIILRANGPVLIRIEDSRGNVVVSHTLAAGDRYQVPPREDLVVVAGDGGRVGVEIDGVARGTLGTPGEIVVGRPLRVSALIDDNG